MSETPNRRAQLSPERRVLLQKLMLRQAAAQADAGAIRPREGDGPAPLSFAQQRLWFVDQMEPGSSAYNIPVFLRLRGRLDAAALRRALDEVVRRHEALRTRFVAADGEPVQQVDPAAPVPLPVVELRALPEGERESETRRRMEAESTRPFDLARGPLLRALLLRTGEEEHVLAVTQHHVVSDAWSMGILTRELAALYGAFAAGESSPLPEPALQYADYAAWQRGRLGGEALDAQLAWWTERMRGVPPLLELPTDHPRGVLRATWAQSVPVALSREAADALRALAREEDATPFMAVLAAWQLLLARHAGTEDVVVGTPIAGRTRVELEEVVGFFVNTLAIRTDLSGDPTFRGLLRRVRETMHGAHQHQDLPFERLVEALGTERSLTHAPLFQVMFSLEDGAPAAAGMRLGPLEAEPVATGRVAVKFDLTLSLWNRGGALAGGLAFRADLWDRPTVERMVERFAALVERVAADPDQRISEVSLLGPAERERVLTEWNATDAPFSDGACLHELIEARARLAPDAPALAHGPRTLTYAELDRAADRIAHSLRARGIAPEVRVALFFEPAPEMVVALLAVLKAGGAYVPLDTGSPAERLAFLLEDCGARLVLTTAELADRLPAFGGEVVVLGGDEARPGQALTPRPPLPMLGEGEHDGITGQEALPQNWGRVASPSEPGGGLPPRHDTASQTVPFPPPSLAGEGPGVGGVSPENLAYVIYTSGSTGQPKGVLVPHRGVCNSTEAYIRIYGIRPGSRVLLFAPLHFDASVLDVFTALCSGATLVLASREEMMPGEALVELLRRERVTHLKITPSALAVTPAAELPELEAVMVGGEACSAELVARWAPGRRFFNGYGATEHSVRCTAQRCTDGTRPPPVGRPIANARLYVLDERFEPVPVGIPGEVYMAGLPVTRGYLNRPELSAERFLPDPYRGEAGARMYRSGDRGRWRADGTLEFVGRTDYQVKVRGFRVEPGEVEAALLEHAGLVDAVVVARGEAAEERHLAAYVVAREGARGPGAAELREHLRGRLPEYMVPSGIVVMDALPLTPNGKVDRRALPDPAEAEGAGYVTPRTPAEEVLAAVWASTLGIERVGAHDDFFALGGHSLAATVVASRVRKAFGVELPLRAIFEAPTVAGLAERMDALLRDGTGVVLPSIAPVPRDRPLPLSFAQQRLWFIEQLEPGAGSYNILHPVRLRGRLDPTALRRALSDVVRRHEALRTRFAETDGEPVQVVDVAAPVPLPLVDLGDIPAGARVGEAVRLAARETLRPFDLARGPLLRVSLLRLDDAEWVLLLGTHHAVYDGWSAGVLTYELDALYTAYATGREPSLPEPPVQYADYAAWQRAWLAGDALDRQVAWWRERLAGAPPFLDLSTDRPRPAVPGARGATLSFSVPAETERGLQALARTEGATLFMALLAAWQLLLARYAGTDDVVVGTPIAGRTRQETEGLIGFFANTLALRTDLSGRPTFRALLARVRETALGAYAHQDVPFERLVEALQVERSLAHTPVFQVLFGVLSRDRSAAGPARIGDLAVERLELGEDAARVDLDLKLAERAEGLSGVLTYRAELWDRATVERMAAHLGRLLASAAARPDVPFPELEMMGEDERAQVVSGWNATAAPYPAGLCAHHLFEAQARRTPAAVALVAGGARLTYAELDARADRLAGALVRRGVGPDARVALCLDRSAELLVAVLAVLKAGGAYVPLDPEYPAERLAFMLADSGARVLLTQAELADRLPAFGGETVVLEGAPSPPDPLSLTRGEGEHDDGTAQEALPHSWGRVASPSEPGGGLSPDNLAYVIYTSGSTGRPKGVAMPHRPLVNLVAWQEREWCGPRPAVTLQFASISFDVSFQEIFACWAGGGTLVVAPEEARGDPAALLALLEQEEVERLFLPYVALQQVAEEAVSRGAFPASLREVHVAGEQLRVTDSIRRWLGGLDARLHNHYGPSETHVATRLTLGHDAGGWPLLPAIGAPVANARGYVLDGELAPLPPGVPGELYLGGACLARGYLDRPDLTAERFVPDPFAPEPGARVYRTGDRARWRADGTLEFLGRADQQVKVRGFRVEPGEVEAALERHPEVREAVVVARADASGDRRLAAYVVAEEGASPAAAALRAHLAEHLPGYMVPSTVTVLERFPLTPSGKTDRRALPAPDAPADRGAHVAPRTPTEAAIARIWTEVLEVERVGVQDGFFALGGHSLLATRVASRVRAAFGIELPVRALFEAQTVAALAERVDAAVRAGVEEWEMEEELERLGQLSDEEILKLLEEAR
jgi:amino acid adenylation domain-containing protein